MGKDDDFKFSENVLSVDILNLNSQSPAYKKPKVKGQKYFVVYRCPKCSAESWVTNVCRKCMVNMYATNSETHFAARKRKLRVLNEREAYHWNSMQFLTDKLYQRKSPEWAFGFERWQKEQASTLSASNKIKKFKKGAD